MRKCNITVYDYHDAIHGSYFNRKPDIEPVKYEVEAWCVGGDYGIRAFFFIGDMFCTADGDDGHWWLVNRCSKGWLKEIKEAIVAVELNS
ncbi:hypothetical protein LCGC14_2448760 [marine sediment metagenome]|uniref:Uncharacterized protein n=1 Tax=marine sediment metagenome TaxID=412755 RepID=A0A0F9C4B2_9ZZZZ